MDSPTTRHYNRASNKRRQESKDRKESAATGSSCVTHEAQWQRIFTNTQALAVKRYTATNAAIKNTNFERKDSCLSAMLKKISVRQWTI